MKRAARVDANHAAIRDAIRQIPGALVVDLSHAGDGVPDLVVGYRMRWHFFEIKNPNQPPSKRRLTPAQVQFHQHATVLGLPCTVVESLADVLRALGIEEDRT